MSEATTHRWILQASLHPLAYRGCRPTLTSQVVPRNRMFKQKLRWTVDSSSTWSGVLIAQVLKDEATWHALSPSFLCFPPCAAQTLDWNPYDMSELFELGLLLFVGLLVLFGLQPLLLLCHCRVVRKTTQRHRSLAHTTWLQTWMNSSSIIR